MRKSRFVAHLDRYSDRYQVTRADRVKLLLHYPLFKLAWLADSRADAIGRLASMLLRPTRNYAVHHFITFTGGRLAVTAPVSPSGFASFAEIFLHNEYAVTDERVTAGTLVDLGGNIGMASLYLMNRFPIRRALVVEANPFLASTIRRRLADVNATVTVESAAVLGRTASNGVCFTVAANHRLSSVGQSRGERVKIPAYGLSDLLDRHGITDPDLLKMDIEGSEFDVLREDYSGLLRFRYILVEVHGQSAARRKFLAELAGLGFEVTVRTETPGALVAFASRDTVPARSQQHR